MTDLEIQFPLLWYKRAVPHKEKEDVILILKYCLHHKTSTWHLLCAGGVFQCLECYLEDRLEEALHRIDGMLPKGG